MIKRSILVAVLAGLLPACSSGGAGEVKLGVNLGSAQAAIVAAETEANAADAASIELNRVRILVAVAKVGYAGESPDSAEVGPFAIELTADEIKNGARREFSLGSLPSGTYGGAEIEIDRMPSDADMSDAAFDDFKASSASVLIDGTYQGNAFEFAGHFLAEQGTDGKVTIDESTPLVLEMTVDTSSWFLDKAGAALDPTDEAQHDTLALAICDTLDTQEDAAAPVAQPQHAGGGGGRRGGGGGGMARCVERAP